MNTSAFSVWDWIMYALLTIALVVVLFTSLVQFGVAVYKQWKGRKK